MELREFVKEALTNIVDGVEMANKEQKRFQISGSYHSGKEISGEYVEFNVSITTQNKKEFDAKGKFGIFMVGGQSGGSKTSNDESIN